MMGTKPGVNAGIAASVVVAFAVVWVAVWMVSGPGNALPATVGAAAAALVMLAGGFLILRGVVVPIRNLVRGIRTVREARGADMALSGTGSMFVGDLAKECDALVTSLRVTRREVRKMAQAESAFVDTQKVWLESVVRGLNEGVLVCNLQHRIMLYNPSAVALLDAPEKIGLGRSLGDLLTIAPLRHSLEQLQQRHETSPDEPQVLSAPFVCTSVEGQRTFNGQMALLTDLAGGMTGYIVTLVDISVELERLSQGDSVRRALTRDLRSMVGNLRAAAETMSAYPAMKIEDRGRFEAVVLSESERISRTLDDLGESIRGHLLGRWPMADIYVPDLVRSVSQSLAERQVKVTLVGMPLWLHGDSLSVVQVIETLLVQLSLKTGQVAFEIEPLLGDKRIYLDLIWSGPPIHESLLDTWLDLPCGEEGGRQTLRDVLERHGSEPWSRATGMEGRSAVRVPLLAPHRPQFIPARKTLPARPEFYDFGLMQAHKGGEEYSDLPIREVPFVVFDCEMTGLHPNQGDEIIQIGAVRVVRGRVISGEAAEWLVNPGRPIPPGSIQFHGLTDADVSESPPIAQVLPRFHDFAGDAVLVGHNVAFDMKFITLKERAAGLKFTNPVLDTMLVSSMLDEGEDDHSLDALCDRYGIPISGRHTALGDTIGTAELLLRLIDRLEAQGLTTFGAVMKKTNMAAELRHRGAIVAHGSGGS